MLLVYLYSMITGKTSDTGLYYIPNNGDLLGVVKYDKYGK